MENENKKVQEAAQALNNLIEIVNAGGGFKKLALLDQMRSALQTMCVAAGVSLDVGQPAVVFSSPSSKG